MWPFRKKAEGGTAGADRQEPSSRYAANPMALFLEAYVLSVIGRLPPERDQAIQAMDLGKRLNTRATAWREVVREALDLSETIDTAILDLWYKNSDMMERRGELCDSNLFARGFVDNYQAPGSRVDVWPEGALAAARARIDERQRNHRFDA